MIWLTRSKPVVIACTVVISNCRTAIRLATIATEAAMTTIPHRELRNQSSKILERVKNGETIDVTNNGEVAATLIPPSASPFERLLLSGNVRPASGPVDFQVLRRVTSDVGTAEMLSDLRGDR
jgi:prevent-host-death family protein